MVADPAVDVGQRHAAGGTGFDGRLNQQGIAVSTSHGILLLGRASTTAVCPGYLWRGFSGGDAATLADAAAAEEAAGVEPD